MTGAQMLDRGFWVHSTDLPPRADYPVEWQARECRDCGHTTAIVVDKAFRHFVCVNCHARTPGIRMTPEDRKLLIEALERPD